MNNARRNTLGYASYDFSNSGYVVIFQSFLFPIYLAAAAEGKSPAIDEQALWPWLVAATSVAAVISAPFVGRFADHVGKARVFATTVVTSAIAAVLALLLFPHNAIALGLAFFIFNTVFELSQSLYDSFLVNVAGNRKQIVALSTFSWGFGYLGGAMFVGMYLLMKALTFSLVTMLILLAMAFLVLSVPAIVTFWRLPNPFADRAAPQDVRDKPPVTSPVPWSQLAIYWIIADCVAAVMYFAPLHITQNVGLGLTTLGGLMLGGQLLAFPLTVFSGRIAKKIGVVRAIRVSLLVWVLSLFGLYYAHNVAHVILVMIGLATVLGSTQALLRSHFAARISVHRSGEGMGFFAIAQKSASLVAPILVGIVAALTGSIRPAFGVLGALMLTAIVLAARLPEQLGAEEAESL